MLHETKSSSDKALIKLEKIFAIKTVINGQNGRIYVRALKICLSMLDSFDMPKVVCFLHGRGCY